MARMPPIVPSGTDDLVIDLDPREADRKRALRDLRLNTREIPLLRLVGMSLAAVAVLLNDALVLGSFAWAAWLATAAVLDAYALGSWALLRALYRRGRRWNLGIVFLALDLPVLTWAIYRSGADRSWIFFIVIGRVADQAHTTFNRALFFAHGAVLSYAGMIAWVAGVEGRTVAWPAEAAKLALIYGTGLYIALTALTAERARTRRAAAIRMARALIGQLEEAKTRALEASRAKSLFLANMSHELRTPLNAVIGFAQVLSNQTYGELNARQLEYLANILASGRHLLNLVNDVLDLSKVEAGRMALDLTPIDIAAELRDVAAIARTLARPKGIGVSLALRDPLPPVTADRAKFKQILYNLLSNAIKFTAPGGHVTVTTELTLAPLGGDGVVPALRVSVEDTGLGIKAEDQTRIFEAFEQVDSSDAREQQGTGLGLALTRKLVELHGGRIWVESAGVAGKGSVFAFLLPVEPPTGAPRG